MQSLKRDNLTSVTESDHEIGYDEPDDQPALDEEAVLACLDADVTPNYGGEPITGIRNGIICGTLIWAMILSVFVLLT
ncbi:MAG: hypothetical protein HKN84_06535 [Gammaproteobacteria bacterium]|nr:hypothetical protein [Gammaproteobacteria bacterium]